jgi:Phage integrase family
MERADRLLRERGELPFPKGLSPHKLRHAFASILVACGTDPASVMRQIGHRSAAFTLDVYTHMMATSPEQRERLQALVEGERRWGPAPPSRLGSSAYKEPILRALSAGGGSARRSDVLAVVEAEMSGRLGSGDRELVGSKPRWQADFDVACRRLREHGLVARGPREGIWVLTRAGADAQVQLRCEVAGGVT